MVAMKFVESDSNLKNKYLCRGIYPQDERNI